MNRLRNIIPYSSLTFLKGFLFLIFMGSFISADIEHSKIRSIYSELEGDSKPDFKLFEKAYLGYIDLKLSGISNPSKNILTIVDFRLSSKDKRMWVIDLSEKDILYNVHVAHGKNSGEEYATYFSNVPNSNKSSLGFYVTSKTYFGKNGLSLKLKGVERGFNSNAFERYIVLHGADYADLEYLEENGILGNSEGCPAVPMAYHREIIDVTKEGTVLFLYYPDIRYLEQSSYMMELF